jgi:hypothetical protein
MLMEGAIRSVRGDQATTSRDSNPHTTRMMRSSGFRYGKFPAWI